MIRAPLLFSALAAVLTPGLAHAHGGHDRAAGMVAVPAETPAAAAALPSASKWVSLLMV